MDKKERSLIILRKQLRDQAIQLGDQGNWQEALKKNEQILIECNFEAQDFNRIAKCYKELGLLSEADKAYQKALELDPQNKIALENIELLREMISNKVAKIKAEAGSESQGKDTRENETKLSVGIKVRIKNSNTTGVITEVLPNNQFRIFINERKQPILAGEDIELIRSVYTFSKPQDFLRDLLIFKLRHPMSDILYSYSMSRTNFEAYQFKPAIKFLRNPSNRILIADEVGLGKTIEACIIYLELKTRLCGDMPRVLIVCPAGLRAKWQSELLSRFGEEFQILDTQDLNNFFNNFRESGMNTRINGIISLETARSDEITQKFIELGVSFDLVIIDEAHHMRNPETLSFDLGETLSNLADSLVLLTATPVHLSDMDLYYLLNILDPVQFESPAMFKYQLEPNKVLNGIISDLAQIPPDLNSAMQKMAKYGSNFSDNPIFADASSLLSQAKTNSNVEQKRRLIQTAIRRLSDLNTFALVFNRTRRKDVAKSAQRSAVSLNVSLTQIESQIYSEVLKWARARLKERKGNISILGLIQIERQLASSIGAFKEIVADYMNNTPSQVIIEESSPDMTVENTLPEDDLFSISRNLSKLYGLLGDVDSKYEAFYSHITSILEKDPNAKIIVFSFFRKTISYLERRLSKSGYTIKSIHGGKKVSERQYVIDSFHNDSSAHILLSSEVGAEGLDMQFCNTIINYDLPWNPMRVEQRIGRIDRYGQLSEKIRIISLFLNNTIEEHILQKLYDRIGIFQESIGALEPILGDIVTTISNDVMSSALTPQEEQRKIEEFFNMLETRKLELENFEQNKYEIMGQDALFTQEVEEDLSKGRYVSPKEVSALVSAYISSVCPKSALKLVDASTDNWVLIPDDTLKSNMLEFINDKNNKCGKEEWSFISKLSDNRRFGNNKSVALRHEIPLTFNSMLALKRPLLEFVSVRHPLVRLAYWSLEKTLNLESERNLFKLKIKSTVDDKGTYYFFVFHFSHNAITKSDELISIVCDNSGIIRKDLSDAFLKLAQDTFYSDSFELECAFDMDTYESVKAKILEYMSNIKGERESFIKQNNDSLINLRRSVLEKTYEAKKNRVLARLQKAVDQRIINMCKGELRNLDAKLQIEIENLNNKKNFTVYYQPVASGIICLE